MATKSRLISELKASLFLTIPLVAAQLAQSATAFVDTIMMGMLGSPVLAAGGLGAMSFAVLLIIPSGIVSAVSPLVAEAYGAGNQERVGRVLRQGVILAVILAIPISLLLGHMGAILQLLGQAPATIALTDTYLRAIAWGYAPALCFAVLRSFVSALSKPRSVMVIVILGTLLNVVGNYGLMFGKLGLPALGLAGIGWASTLSLWSMLIALTVYILRQSELKQYLEFAYRKAGDRQILMELVKIGLPIGAMIGVEAVLFATTTLLMGQLGTTTLAAHQIALQTAAITFNVPIGISLATTVRVGQLLGQNDRQGIRLAGFVPIALSSAFMMAMGLLFWIFPEAIVALYLDTHNPANRDVLALAKTLLGVAAIFQLVDGIQVVAAGALRGLQDTRVPMVIAILSYWGIGLPGGYLLATRLQLGAVGLWWGLALGLLAAAVILSWRFVWQSQEP